MNIALFGATGTIGQRILREALERGHTVTAIVRDPSRLKVTHDRLRVVIGDIFDTESVAAGVKGQDAVISSYGPGIQTEDAGKILTSTDSLVAGLRQAGVKRVIVVGGAGSLEVAPGVQLIDTPAFPEAYKAVALVHRDVLYLYQKEGNDLEWTYFSPAAVIQPGERTGKFRVGGDQLVVDAEGNSAISAEDYAIALIDELEKPAHIRGRFTVAY